jgi:hypothetical protein
MPEYTYRTIQTTVDELGNTIEVYAGGYEAALATEPDALEWALRCAISDGHFNVFMDTHWTPVAGLGDTVTYCRRLWGDEDDMHDEHATPVGELLTTEETAKSKPKPTAATPAELHWAGLAIEELAELCDRAEDAIRQLRRNLFVDVTGLSIAFGDAMKKIGRAAAEREANKRATTTR